MLALVFLRMKINLGNLELAQFFISDLTHQMMEFVCPLSGMEESGYVGWTDRELLWISPLLGIAEAESGQYQAEDGMTKTVESIDLAEKPEENEGEEYRLFPDQPGRTDWQVDDMDSEIEESGNAETLEMRPQNGDADNPAAVEKCSFVPHEKVKEIDLEKLKDYETLVKSFYTIDATTMAGSDQLNVEKLMGRDMRLEKGGDGPQILIYHTHSQEGFRDSVAGDPYTTIVGVGEELARILREDYGYQVLHHTGEYDKPSRNAAYSRALPKIEEVLEENTSIQVVIDLHRDAMPEQTRLVTEIDGKKTAKLMFFNGLSRTRQTGNLDYLYNVYQEDNLAFSFQMEKAAQEYYPDLTRKIYLKGYRYNMHLKPRTLLIELGAQNNTLEEAMNACGPLAHILNVVLQGE